MSKGLWNLHFLWRTRWLAHNQASAASPSTFFLFPLSPAPCFWLFPALPWGICLSFPVAVMNCAGPHALSPVLPPCPPPPPTHRMTQAIYLWKDKWEFRVQFVALKWEVLANPDREWTIKKKKKMPFTFLVNVTPKEVERSPAHLPPETSLVVAIKRSFL